MGLYLQEALGAQEDLIHPLDPLDPRWEKRKKTQVTQ